MGNDLECQRARAPLPPAAGKKYVWGEADLIRTRSYFNYTAIPFKVQCMFHYYCTATGRHEGARQVGA